MEILVWAHDMRHDQFVALDATLPSWARIDGYDIEAVANAPLTAPQCRQLIQALFTDRFRMKSHWKTIPNSPVFELRVASRGTN